MRSCDRVWISLNLVVLICYYDICQIMMPIITDQIYRFSKKANSWSSRIKTHDLRSRKKKPRRPMSKSKWGGRFTQLKCASDWSTVLFQKWNTMSLNLYTLSAWISGYMVEIYNITSIMLNSLYAYHPRWVLCSRGLRCLQ